MTQPNAHNFTALKQLCQMASPELGRTFRGRCDLSYDVAVAGAALCNNSRKALKRIVQTVS